MYGVHTCTYRRIYETLVFTLSDNTSLYIFSRNKFEVGISGKVDVWRQPISSLIASSTIDCNYGVKSLEYKQRQYYHYRVGSCNHNTKFNINADSRSINISTEQDKDIGYLRGCTRKETRRKGEITTREYKRINMNTKSRG